MLKTTKTTKRTSPSVRKKSRAKRKIVKLRGYRELVDDPYGLKR